MTAMDQLLSCLPHAPAFTFNWPGLRALPPLEDWFCRMEKTPQNPEWHGEDDVWTHTWMVCDALTEIEAFRAMEESGRNVLALAALLHDIGKVPCTQLEDGKWVSPHHGPAGAQIARGLLWRDFGFCGDPKKQRFREAVCLLIRYHTQPLHLIEGKNPAVRAMKLAANGELAPDFTLEALCLLSEADARGRVAPDIPKLLDTIALSRELARENDCLNGPYAFTSARTQRALFSGVQVWRDQELFDDTWGEVILMCGLPGTGKDTWIRKNHPDWPTVCLDDIRREMGVKPGDNQGRVAQAAKEKAKGYLRSRKPFIWNATSLTSLRAQQIDLFESYHARARIVYLETEWEENLRRNAGRADAVPQSVIENMLEKLEPPERWEAQQIEWICTE